MLQNSPTMLMSLTGLLKDIDAETHSTQRFTAGKASKNKPILMLGIVSGPARLGWVCAAVESRYIGGILGIRRRKLCAHFYWLVCDAGCPAIEWL